MAKRGRRPPKIQLKAGEAPALWQYESLNHALTANVGILAELIVVQRGKSPRPAAEDKTGASAPLPHNRS